MKIRTDFVTNSSSYNTVEVIIENPVLLEILQKYKDKGLFGDKAPYVGIGTYTSTNELWSDSNKGGDIPAFYFFEDEDDSIRVENPTYGAPESLEEVLGWIVGIMSEGKEYLDEDILNELEKELTEKADEINQAYVSVEWTNDQLCDDGDSKYEFTYNKKNGERFIHISTLETEFYNTLEYGDLEEKAELRDGLGYGNKGNEKDDYWEYAKKVGYIGDFEGFPMDKYNKYKETGEIEYFELWYNLLDREDDGEDNDEDQD